MTQYMRSGCDSNMHVVIKTLERKKWRKTEKVGM